METLLQERRLVFRTKFQNRGVDLVMLPCHSSRESLVNVNSKNEIEG